MTTELMLVLQSVVMVSLVLSAQILLVLLLRKPVRTFLGSVACYRLWPLSLLWLPAYAIGEQLLLWWQAAKPPTDVQSRWELDSFQLLLSDWVYLPLQNIGSDYTAVSNGFDPWSLVALLWLGGCCAVIGWQIQKFRRFSALLQEQGQPVTVAAGQFAAVRVVLGNTMPTMVLPGMSSAALFGVRKPVLLLPQEFGHYDTDQQHIILAHEAVHLRRRDNLWNLLVGLLVVINWFNPLCWLAWRCYRFDQELSCDALALVACNHTQQKRYARTLLDVASTMPGFGSQPVLSAWDNLNDLKERTLMIAQHLKTKVSPLLVQSCLSVIAVGGAAMMVLLAGCVSPVTEAAEPVSATTASSRASQSKSRFLTDVIEVLNRRNPEEVRAQLPLLQQRLDSGESSAYESAVMLQIMFSIHVQNEQYAEARAAMEKALAVGDAGLNAAEQSQARYQLAQLWFQQEEWQQGADALETWLQTATNPKGGAYYLQAAAYYNLEEFEKALIPAEKAVAIGGDNSQESWRQMLSALYLQLEQYDKALPVIREQVRLYPDKEVYKNQLSNVEQKLQAAQTQ